MNWLGGIILGMILCEILYLITRKNTKLFVILFLLVIIILIFALR